MQETTLDIHYVGSYKSVSECPMLPEPEYCFIGRSNVGKSSIINYITGRDEIARTSKKPGKTQSINLFKVTEESPWMMADLPGYGFAAISKTTRGEWSEMIDGYVMGRQNLVCTFLLIDIRHKRLENDREFMNYMGEKGIPFCILYTKSDKLKPMELKNSLAAYEEAMLTEWEAMPPTIVTSSVKDLGRQEILDYIHNLNEIFKSQAL